MRLVEEERFPSRIGGLHTRSELDVALEPRGPSDQLHRVQNRADGVFLAVLLKTLVNRGAVAPGSIELEWNGAGVRSMGLIAAASFWLIVRTRFSSTAATSGQWVLSLELRAPPLSQKVFVSAMLGILVAVVGTVVFVQTFPQQTLNE
mmetsp:Transcript_7959/g.19813  ORF Transcript_7959/g.19813 Transcript_7959/m.19813 type:complete len:148 (+) Transcript_7959:2095-2538(+)